MNKPPSPAQKPSLRKQAISFLTSGRFAEGIALLEKAAAQDPNSADIQNELGTAHWQSGQPEKAEAFYKKALQLSPDNTYALNSYGAFLLEQYRLDDARPLLEKAVQRDPANAEVQNNMGLLSYRSGDMAAAEKYLIEAIRRNPKWANPHANIGNVLRDTKRPELAEKAYKQALHLHPRHAQAWHNLGGLYAERGRTDEALAALQRVVTYYPQMEAAWTNMFDILEKSNSLDAAEETLRKAKSVLPASPYLALSEAKLLRRQGKTDAAFAVMEDFAGKVRHTSARNAGFFYELGQLYDRRNEPAKAFDAFEKANACKAQTSELQTLKLDVYTNLAARIRREVTANTVSGPLPEEEPATPVFLVAFPRSGTTLLDQIMASHPDIAVAEEKSAVDRMAHYVVRRYGTVAPQDHPLADGCYPAALPDLTAQDIRKMREIFQAEHGGPAQKLVFVDKLPLNIFHIGIIRRVFPKAKIILALRHPCDSVLSCFMQDFRLNPAMARFLDLQDSAKFYDEAFSVWNHYAKTLPLDVHTIKYEDVVADFQPTVAKLLEFLNVPWNDAVLEYDKTAREKGLINTPSYHQVTQKIYTRASGRWLKYREQLKPVLDILKPHAERHGYAMTDGEEA